MSSSPKSVVSTTVARTHSIEKGDGSEEGPLLLLPFVLLLLLLVMVELFLLLLGRW